MASGFARALYPAAKHVRSEMQYHGLIGQYKKPIGPVGLKTQRSGHSLSTEIHRPDRPAYARGQIYKSNYKAADVEHHVQGRGHLSHAGYAGGIITSHPYATAGAVAGVAGAAYGAHKAYKHFQHRDVAPMHEKAASTFHATHTALG